MWGYGKAVGYKYKDIVVPTKKLSHYTNIIQLAAGATHSLALTGTHASTHSITLTTLYAVCVCCNYGIFYHPECFVIIFSHMLDINKSVQQIYFQIIVVTE